eukprot:1183352-Prorocentrum_minimum.AAC.4
MQEMSQNPLAMPSDLASQMYTSNNTGTHPEAQAAEIVKAMYRVSKRISALFMFDYKALCLSPYLSYSPQRVWAAGIKSGLAHLQQLQAQQMQASLGMLANNPEAAGSHDAVHAFVSALVALKCLRSTWLLPLKASCLQRGICAANIMQQRAILEPPAPAPVHAAAAPAPPSAFNPFLFGQLNMVRIDSPFCAFTTVPSGTNIVVSRTFDDATRAFGAALSLEERKREA